MAYGLGVLRGMGMTLRHFLESYLVGFKEQPIIAGDLPHDTPVRGLAGGMSVRTGGLITAQYPEQKLPVPERFRYLPFLVFEEAADSERAAFDGIRCTACGICAKVCPPQCIWIVQGKGADGRPRPVPTAFTVDASVCMSCGLCAEFCPFDSIRMDHEYELTSYERRESWILDLEALLRPLAYHAAIHPTAYRAELAERRAKEAARQQRAKPAAAAAAPADEEALARQRKAEARQRFLAQRARQKGDRERPAGGEGS